MKTKLLQLKEGLIIIDEEAQIMQDDWYINDKNEVDYLRSDELPMSYDKKIIASSFIDGLPKISQSVEEIRQMIKDKEIEEYVINFLKKQHPNFEWNNISRAIKEDMVDLLKSNKNEYTREQMIEAVNMAREFDMCKGHLNKTEQILESLEPKIDCYVEVEEIKLPCGCNKYSGEPEFICNCAETVHYKVTKIL